MTIKYFLIIAVLATAVLAFAAVGANAQTSAEWCHNFNKSFGYENSGNSEVGFLHTALQKEGISFSPDTGNKFSKEGGTSSAVIAFQEKYGILPLSGYVGPLTRAKLNELYACSYKACNTNKQCATVAGPGNDLCVKDSNCVVSHKACSNKKCVLLSGAGTDTCQTNAECVNPTHKACNVNNQCISVAGEGDNLCVNNADCAIPTIKVKSPNGGESYTVGKNFDIKWTSQGIDSNLPIAFSLIDYSQNKTYASGCSVDIKVSAGIASTSYGACLPSLVPVGNQYKAQVCIATKDASATYCDESNNYFSIVIKHKECNDKQQCVSVDGAGTDECASNAQCRGTITVTVPAGGETWQKGETHEITWTANNKVDTVDIYRYGYDYLETVTSRDKIAEGIPASLGAYSWIIPADFNGANPGRSKIVIRKVDVTSDFSKVFSIIDAPAVTVTFPNGGETLLPGQKYNIKWTETALKDSIISIVLTDSAGNETEIASLLKAPSKSYSWLIPLTITPGTQYKITVSALSSGSVEAATVSDTNDNYFSIGAIHNACDLKMQCISVVGVGTSACSADSDCVAATHNECATNKQCVAVMGAGEKKCSKNSDCSSPIATSAGLEQSIFNSMTAALANIAEQLKALLAGR